MPEIIIGITVFVVAFVIDFLIGQKKEESHKLGKSKAKKVYLEKTFGVEERFPQPKILERPDSEQGYVILNGIKRRIEDCKNL